MTAIIADSAPQFVPDLLAGAKALACMPPGSRPRRATRLRDSLMLTRMMPAKIMLIIIMLALAPAGPALAARFAGVTLPDTMTASGTTLTLNGIGLRTYSLLGIHIYVAGLYLRKPSHDAGAILASPGVKVLVLHFVHDVSAAKVRDTWRKGLRRNCIAPCSLRPDLLVRFLASLPGVHAGETVELVFTNTGMHAYYDGKLAGGVADPQFSRLMLAVFLGPRTSLPRLKTELLGLAGGSAVNPAVAPD
ncbi:chalcone isomerase family protein [Acidocella sp.]|uniref:chalcone isomerase family protein n=1 Tax=Acidocella sp. TaxID=50710 RepID=UPI0026350C5B|nr:chalcone isomerase family protein [Acidocella sp.]